MAEKPSGQSTGSSVMPWTALLALLVATGGALFYYSPLKSARPDTAPDPRPESLGYQDARARLWQDPFRAAEDRRRELHPDAQSTKDDFFKALLAKRSDPHDVAVLRRQICERIQTKDAETPVLILPVMVPAGAYGELVEQRLRLRVAVLEAIGVAGYQPADVEHIGYVEVPWAWRQPSTRPAEDKQFINSPDHRQRLLVPYEWCDATTVRMAGTASRASPNYKSVLVIWLDEEAMTDAPLARLAYLLGEVRGRAPCQRIRTSIIGPRVSGTLRKMLEEVGSNKAGSDVANALADVQMFAATPTAENRVLMTGAADITPADPTWLDQTLKTKLPTTRGAHFQIHRTTLTDDDLCATVVAELERRQIRVWANIANPQGDIADVAIVAELDTWYGRALPLTFAAAASNADVVALAKGYVAFPSWIHPFVYLRGIDGKIATPEKLPGQDSVPSSKYAGNQEALKTQAPSEPPEGMNQADYLRRLADQLADVDGMLRGQGKPGLRAIGVLGTDVYDTLLILRALHDRLPDAVYFTTELDARFSVPTEWPATHNLIVVTPFGLRLHHQYQHNVPPFRDSLQTSVFASTQLALGSLQPGNPAFDFRSSLGRPRIFEIGRSGPFDLSVDKLANLDSVGDASEFPSPSHDRALLLHTIHPPRYDLASWPPQWTPWIAMATVILASLLLCYALTSPPYPLPRMTRFLARLIRGPGRLILLSRSKQVLAITPLAVVFSILLASVIVYFFAIFEFDRVHGPPLAPFDRVSPWPTEFLRLIAAFLCIHFVLKAWVETNASNTEVERKFRLKPLRRARMQKTNAKGVMKPAQLKHTLKIEQWDVLGNQDGVPPVTPADHKNAFVLAQNLWWEYGRHGGYAQRIARALMLTVLFILFTSFLMAAAGTAQKPLRGPMIQTLDAIAAWPTFILYAFLTFFVIDATILNSRFILHLTVRPTYYPYGAFQQFNEFGLEAEDLTEYADIRLIATRTRVVGEVIYYPFLIFFLIVIARSTLFADWKWPTASIFILLICLILAIIAALSLRRSAEKARSQALARIRQRIITATKDDDPKAHALEQIYDLVAAERDGAFALLSRHPYIAALLLPSGSIGIWALLEFVARRVQG